MDRRLIVPLLFLVASSCSPNGDPGWQRLISGKSLDGWTGDRDRFSVERGELVASGSGFAIRHEGEVADFDLTFDCRVESGAAAIAYRVGAEGRGYRFALDPEGFGAIGSSAGELIAAAGQRVGRFEGAFQTGHLWLPPQSESNGWRRCAIEARGPWITHRVDGDIVSVLRDESLSASYAGGLELTLLGDRTSLRMRDLSLRCVPASTWSKRVVPPPIVGSGPERVERPKPEWIWARPEAGDGETIAFRRRFEVTAEPTEATLLITADNRFECFLNGEKVGPGGADWERVFRYDLTDRLKVGDNVLAVAATNTGGPAGLLLGLSWTDATGDHSIRSDAEFLAHEVPAGAWTGIEFNEAGWPAAYSFGPHDRHTGPWSDVMQPKVATPVSAITVPAGFEVELIHSAQVGEGSWSAMTFDDEGRLIISPQAGKLLRMTLPAAGGGRPRIEVLDDLPVGDAQGLLYAYDSLYVNVNAGSDRGGLYRCFDEDRDGAFERTERLTTWGGGGEHGCHAVILGKDGALYMVHGNYTTDLGVVDSESPFRNYAEDLLAARAWDPRGHAVGKVAPGAHILKTDRDGSTFSMIAAGMRNPYDLAFNQHDELFTFDADMEWDIGLPWYRPTRVVHLVSGGEYGWRSGSGKWPTAWPDSLPPVVDIGIGSPTGVVFGGGSYRTRDGQVVRGASGFPEPYRSSLLIMDWAYGKIFAVHLDDQGASYRGTFEEFCVGRPLNVTDMEFGPDGALYFTTGGRGTQSGLYRVRYVGDAEIEDPPVDRRAESARHQRRLLERFHGAVDDKALTAAWRHMGSADRFVRFAARVAVERQPIDWWRRDALEEPTVDRRLAALLALARVGSGDVPAIVDAIESTPVTVLDRRQLIEELRVVQVAFARQGTPSPEVRSRLLARYDALYPGGDLDVDRDLFVVLNALGASKLPERAMATLRDATSIEEQILHAFQMREVKDDWTPETRDAYFGWLESAVGMEGGMSLPGYLRGVEEAALSSIAEAQRAKFAERLEQARERAQSQKSMPVAVAPPTGATPRWSAADLKPHLASVASGRSFDRGREAYQKGLCVMCHRFAGGGGYVGPDLTGVASRFSRGDLLDTILTPSKDISSQYEDEEFLLNDGTVVVGRVVKEDRTSVHVEVNPLQPSRQTLYKGAIARRSPSKVSPMPERLLDSFELEEILDLLAYLESAGNPSAAAFR